MSSSPLSTVAARLLDKAAARATGILTLSRGQVRKQLFLRDGVLVAAESNLREEALGELLVTLGVLPRTRLNQLLAEVKRRGQRMGTVLLELGWATPDDVLASLREQVRRRAQSCLRWTEADATFEETPVFVGTLIEHRFELPALVFSGLRDSPTLELLTPALDQSPEAIVALDPAFERWRAEFEQAFGSELPLLLAEPGELGALVLRPDSGTLIYGLEALLTSGLVRITLPDPAALGVPQAAPAQESGSFAAGGNNPHSGFLVPAPSSTGSNDWRKAPESSAEPGQFPGELALEYLQMHSQPPHHVLGVGLRATRQEIEEAYTRRLAAIDRVAAGTVLHPKLAEMIEAYARAYAALQAPAPVKASEPPAEPPAVSPPPAQDPLGAELAFGEARALLASGRPAEAVPLLRRAVDSRPDQAAYHAWLGWTLFEVDARTGMPEALDRLEHAVAVDPDSVEGHALLGRLLARRDDLLPARVHLERTLALRPEQPESIDLLARLHVEAGEPEQAERLYRRLIVALGERALPLRRKLWRALAELCEGPLVDPAGAARAYEMAARLSPDDPGLRRRTGHSAT